MTTVNLSLDAVHQLAYDALSNNGCDHDNATAVADTITVAERDLCHSHGLFRLPGYVASLKSGKVNGNAKPRVEKVAPGVLRTDADNGYAPLALKTARDPLADCAKENGIAAMALVMVLLALLTTSDRPSVLRRAARWAIGTTAVYLILGFGVPLLLRAVAPDQAEVLAALLAALLRTTLVPSIVLGGVGAVMLILALVFGLLGVAGSVWVYNQATESEAL